MATLNYIRETRQSASVMKRVIDYCTQDYKVTDPDSGRRYVSGIGCDGENSYTEFMATKKCFGKASGVFFYQYEQSFSPDERITPETAHTVALEFAERAWQGHEVLVTTHVDRHHLHTHFVINSVSYRDGSKLRQSPQTLEKLRALNDEICHAHGLSILEPYTGGGMHISAREYRAAMKGESWKFRLMASINHAMERSGTREDFIREMEGLGYQVRWTAERKYITYTCPNGMKCRDIKLHEEKYRKEMMEREFQYRTDKQNGRRFDHEEFGTSGKIETAQEPKIVTMPYDRRQEEIELLRTAVQFQPTLYMLIKQLATQKDMERCLNQTVATEEEYMRKMANSFSEKAQTMTKEVSELLQQDGKRREKFISDCTQALQTERDKLTAQLDSLRKRTRRILITISITAIALSALVSYLVCRVLGS